MIKIIKITICLVFRYSVSTNGKLASIMPGINPVDVASQKLLTPSLPQPVKHLSCKVRTHACIQNIFLVLYQTCFQ